MPTLDVQRLRQSSKHKIICSHPSGFRLVGFRQDEFAIGTQAEYSNPFANSMQDKSVQINAMTSELSSAVGRVMGDDRFDALPTLNLQTKEQTRHQWVSSGRPQIPVNITLLRMQMNDDSVSKIAAKMTAMALHSGTNNVGTVGFLKSPGGYNPGSNSDPGGTWTVKIGDFFHADKLVLLSAQMVLSEAPVSDGSPLYGILQCMFEPYMIVTAQEFEGWFKK